MFFLFKSWPLLSWVHWMFGIFKFKTFRFMWLNRQFSKFYLKSFILDVSNDYKYNTYTIRIAQHKGLYWGMRRNLYLTKVPCLVIVQQPWSIYNVLHVPYISKVRLNIIHNFLFRVNGVHYIWSGAPASLLTNTISLFLFSALFSDKRLGMMKHYIMNCISEKMWIRNRNATFAVGRSALPSAGIV